MSSVAVRHRKGPKDQTRRLLIDALTEVGDMTATELTLFTGVPNRSVQYNMRRALDLKEVHVAGWVRQPGLGGSYAAVYRPGPGRSVRMTKSSPEAAHRRKIEWQRERRRDLALKSKLQRRAKSGSLTPFTGMVVQLGGRS